MRELAERLIAQETSQKSPKPTALLVCERLRLPLATLMGTVGFGALLSRALSLAIAESPGLRALHVDAVGALQGWTEREARPGPDKSFDGDITLLAHLLGLLATFIGEDLTLRLLQELWPKLRLDNPTFAEGSRK
ncbi:MAG: hypothetical protein Q8M19_18375 [Reyranella sp.]|nr:hypothetical protein [Reyranella sp.]